MFFCREDRPSRVRSWFKQSSEMLQSKLILQLAILEHKLLKYVFWAIYVCFVFIFNYLSWNMLWDKLKSGFLAYFLPTPFLMWHLKSQEFRFFGFSECEDGRNKAICQARQEVGLFLVFIWWNYEWGTVLNPNKSVAFPQMWNSGPDCEWRDKFRSHHYPGIKWY